MRVFSATLLILVSLGTVYASELSVVGGRSITGDLKLDSERIDLKDSTNLGARYEKDFLFILGFENSFMYGRRLLTPKEGPGEDGLYYSGALVLNLSSASVAPNFALGLGFLYRFGNSFPKSGFSFLTTFGGGLKLRDLAGPVGLRIDYRRVTFYGIQGSKVGTNEITGGAVISF